MGGYFADTDLAAHIDQHRRPEAREFSVKVDVGDKSADFEVFAHVVEHGLLIFRRVYLFQPTARASSATNYWTIKVFQHDSSGREIDLATLDGSKLGFVADKPLRIPAHGNVNRPLLRELPILVRGTKTGSPSATDDLVVQLVLALR